MGLNNQKNKLKGFGKSFFRNILGLKQESTLQMMSLFCIVEILKIKNYIYFELTSLFFCFWDLANPTDWIFSGLPIIRLGTQH